MCLTVVDAEDVTAGRLRGAEAALVWKKVKSEDVKGVVVAVIADEDEDDEATRSLLKYDDRS
jgi:ribosomal protein L13